MKTIYASHDNKGFENEQFRFVCNNGKDVNIDNGSFFVNYSVDSKDNWSKLEMINKGDEYFCDFYVPKGASNLYVSVDSIKNPKTYLFNVDPKEVELSDMRSLGVGFFDTDFMLMHNVKDAMTNVVVPTQASDDSLELFKELSKNDVEKFISIDQEFDELFGDPITVEDTVDVNKFESVIGNTMENVYENNVEVNTNVLDKLVFADEKYDLALKTEARYYYSNDRVCERFKQSLQQGIKNQFENVVFENEFVLSDVNDLAVEEVVEVQPELLVYKFRAKEPKMAQFRKIAQQNLLYLSLNEDNQTSTELIVSPYEQLDEFDVSFMATIKRYFNIAKKALAKMGTLLQNVLAKEL